MESVGAGRGFIEPRDRIVGRSRRYRGRRARRTARRLVARRIALRLCGATITLRPCGSRDRVLAERAHHFVRCRQIGGIGDAHQHHLGGGDRTARRLHLGNTFQQHLPGARQNAHRQLGREGAAADALGLRKRHVIGNGRNDFDARNEMREFGKIAQDNRGIGADVVLLAKLSAGRRRRRPSSAPRTDRPRARDRPDPASAAHLRRAPVQRRARWPDRAAKANRAPSLPPRAQSTPAPPARSRLFLSPRYFRDA